MKNLYNYINLNKPSSSLAQTKINYTNLTATNDMRVLGIFTSRNVKSNLKLSYDTVDQYTIRALDSQSTKELCLGYYTKLLLFCSDVPADTYTSFFCKYFPEKCFFGYKCKLQPIASYCSNNFMLILYCYHWLYFDYHWFIKSH